MNLMNIKDYTDDDTNDFKLYIYELITFSGVQHEVIIIALKYIERLSKNKSLKFFSEYSLFLICLIMADIYINDKSWSLKAWSHHSGIPLKYCLKIKLDFLNMICYDLIVSNEEYEKFLLVVSMIKPETNYLFTEFNTCMV